MKEIDPSLLDPDNHLHLDQSLVRLPFEHLRRNFKSAQRHVEKDRDFITDALHTTATKSAESQTPEETLKSLDKIIARAQGLQRKLETMKREENRMYEHGNKRLEHIRDLYEAPSLSSTKYTNWSKIRLQRMLVDYLLRQGHSETAGALAKKKDIEGLVDTELFSRCQAIRDSLLRQSTVECLSWCHENKLGGKKKENDLEFELRLQQYIELVRTRDRTKILEARTHAQTYLYPQCTDTPSRMAAAAGLLAYPPNTPCEPARTLYSAERWQFLADLFVRTHHALYSVPTRPALHLALTAGLSAIKTPMCHAQESGSRTNVCSNWSSAVCPVCSPELNGLARDVPYANHTTSKNMEAESVFLPNGRVYGLERLLSVIRKFGVGEGRLKDPMTGEIFGIEEIRTVFVS